MKKRKVAILLLIASLCASTVPQAAFAQDVAIDKDDTTKSASTTAALTIDSTVIDDLGYGLIVSIPAEVTMSYDTSNKKFAGSGDVYASGIIASGKRVDVQTTGKTIDTITQDSHTIDVTGHGTCGISTDVTFDADTCLANSKYLKDGAGSLAKNTLSASVDAEPVIKGVTPDTLGQWSTTIPITISIVDSNAPVDPGQDDNPTTTSAGLFNDDGVQTMTWEALTASDGPITVSDDGVCNVKSDSTSKSALAGKLVLGDNVKKIASNGLAGCPNLHAVVVPEGVTEIGNDGLRNCANLINVSLPSTITTLGGSLSGPFCNCPKLSTIKLADGLKSIPSNAFYGCTALTDITIPSSVTTIGTYAFKNCASLTELTIPEGVTEIKSNAISGCTGLTSLTIPSTVTTIGGYGSGIGTGCSKLTRVTFADGMTMIPAYAIHGMTSVTDIVIPTSVTTIGADAFSGCTGLTEVTIPEGVTEIRNSAFSSCTGLTTLHLPSTIKTMYTNGMIISNNSCPKLTTVTFADGLDKIPAYALDGLASITNVTIPSTVTTIGHYAFEGCKGLTDLTIPSTVTTIEDNAFSNVPHVTYTGSASGSPWGATSIN